MKKETQIAIAVAVVLLVIIAIVAIFMLTGGGGEPTPSTTATQPGPRDIDTGIAGGAPPAMPSGGFAPSPTPTPPAPTQQRQVAIRPRKDPFAPLPEEEEAMQGDAFDPNRYFVLASPTPPPKVELPEPPEPQPRRRVAGIVLGSTVSAIIEQEGEPIPLIVQPGDMVGEFRVAAITSDGVILRRSKGNPREVRVPYEPPSFGSGGGAGTGRGSAPGLPGGAPGVPGAPGLPGAPGGRGGGTGI